MNYSLQEHQGHRQQLCNRSQSPLELKLFDSLRETILSSSEFYESRRNCVRINTALGAHTCHNLQPDEGMFHMLRSVTEERFIYLLHTKKPKRKRKKTDSLFLEQISEQTIRFLPIVLLVGQLNGITRLKLKCTHFGIIMFDFEVW